MPLPHPVSVRIPAPLCDRLRATAEAEQRSFSSLLITLIDRGLVERARDRELLSRADRREAA